MILPNSVPLSFLASAKMPKLHAFFSKNVLAHLLILYLSKEHYESLTNKYAELMMLGKTLLCYFFIYFYEFHSLYGLPYLSSYKTCFFSLWNDFK